MKSCKHCGLPREHSEYYRNGGVCRECRNRRARENNAKNSEYNRRRHREKYETHKKMVFGYYGTKCACCGEDELMFLTVDHINNDGNLHRKNKVSTSHHNIYGWLVRNGFPDGFQILCMNCNMGKHRNNGVCPHQIARCNDHPGDGSRGQAAPKRCGSSHNSGS